MIGFELASSPPGRAEPAYVSGAHAGDVRLSGSMTLSLPAPGVRFSAAAITAEGSLSWKGEDSCGTTTTFSNVKGCATARGVGTALRAGVVATGRGEFDDTEGVGIGRVSSALFPSVPENWRLLLFRTNFNR